MSERAAPFHCPYCAEEDLRPVPEPHGAWHCAACLRVFVVRFVGITAPMPTATAPTAPTTEEAAR